MRAIDTNVIVRLVAQDDAAQLAIAVKLLDEKFLILPTVILEAVWVLQSTYRLGRRDIVAKLLEVLGHQNAVPVSANVLNWALEQFNRAGEFADFLHVGLADAAEAETFATFDKPLGRRSLDGLQTRIEKLGAGGAV